MHPNGTRKYTDTYRPSVIQRCLHCGKEFRIKQSSIAAGEGKFCSNSCRLESIHQEAQGRVMERLWSKIAVTPDPSQCWDWMASTFDNGYGQFKVGTKNWRAHRFVWTMVHGPIPDDLVVCHRCDNPLCCNPDHLFLGSNRDNSQDMVSKGRQRGNKGEHSVRGSNHPHAKLTEDAVRDIRKRFSQGDTSSTLGRQYSVTKETILSVVHRKTWRHVQ